MNMLDFNQESMMLFSEKYAMNEKLYDDLGQKNMWLKYCGTA